MKQAGIGVAFDGAVEGQRGGVECVPAQDFASRLPVTGVMSPAAIRDAETPCSRSITTTLWPRWRSRQARVVPASP